MAACSGNSDKCVDAGCVCEANGDAACEEIADTCDSTDGCVCAANGNAACDGKIADYCITSNPGCVCKANGYMACGAEADKCDPIDGCVCEANGNAPCEGLTDTCTSDGCVCAGTETETEAATACDEVNSDYCDSDGCHCAANADNNFGVCTGSQDTCVDSGCVCGANVHDGNSIACLDNADTCTDTGCECSTNEDSEVCDLNSGTPICRTSGCKSSVFWMIQNVPFWSFIRNYVILILFLKTCMNKSFWF